MLIRIFMNMGKGRVATLTGIWKKLIPVFINDFEAFKSSEEETNAF